MSRFGNKMVLTPNQKKVLNSIISQKQDVYCRQDDDDELIIRQVTTLTGKAVEYPEVDTPKLYKNGKIGKYHIANYTIGVRGAFKTSTVSLFQTELPDSNYFKLLKSEV